ncbi:hypothetical protein CRM22_006377 [Opisthorchis felineus]|uniref:Uncharacterized protein n=1 Tax=Opisthorchis felineus TaxID=147828 RepID=A0A4S2LMY5_OPIFE|nr:hypothetical protein CRM22_006377 [Opisthorchis felineus]
MSTTKITFSQNGSNSCKTTQQPGKQEFPPLMWWKFTATFCQRLLFAFLILFTCTFVLFFSLWIYQCFQLPTTKVEIPKESNLTAKTAEPDKPETKVVIPKKEDSSTEDSEPDSPELNLQRDQINIQAGLWQELEGIVNTENMMCHVLTRHLQSNWPAHCADTLICTASITDGVAGKHASVTLWSIVIEANDVCPTTVDQIEESIAVALRSDDREWTMRKISTVKLQLRKQQAYETGNNLVQQLSSELTSTLNLQLNSVLFKSQMSGAKFQFVGFSTDPNQVHYAHYIVMHTSPISGKWMKFGLQLLRDKRLEIGGLDENARTFTIRLPKTQPLVPEAQIIQDETGQFEQTVRFCTSEMATVSKISRSRAVGNSLLIKIRVQTNESAWDEQWSVCIHTQFSGLLLDWKIDKIRVANPPIPFYV